MPVFQTPDTCSHSLSYEMLILANEEHEYVSCKGTVLNHKNHIHLESYYDIIHIIHINIYQYRRRLTQALVGVCSEDCDLWEGVPLAFHRWCGS